MSKLYLGRVIKSGKLSGEKYYLNSLDLPTHVFICGSTGAGKTVLGKCLIEEALLNGVSALVIDLKGDLSAMKIPLYDLTENEISEFIESSSEEEKKEKIQKHLTEFKQMLASCELSVKDVQRFRNVTDIRIFTPKSKVYEQFSVSFLTSAPENFEEIMQTEPETILNSISNQAALILKRLFGEEAQFTMYEEKTLIECAILHLYKIKAELEGKTGIINLIKTIYEVPFERIGLLKVREFISDEKKMNLIRRLNTLLVGADSLWYEGESINTIINLLVKPNNDQNRKSKLYIFNLSTLESFDDRNFVVSNIATVLFNQMRRLGDSREPRVLFYIDEIGGGKLAFFPDDPIQNESKSAINLLLRQGRAFGLSCVLATQNPGDIDYKGLTNCQTWYIGKLLTKNDRDKVMQGISASSYFLESYDSFVKMAGPGDFIAKAKDGTITAFKERWLLTFHKVLTYDELKKLRNMLLYADDVVVGSSYLAKKDYKNAIVYFHNALSKNPDISKAIGLCGECYFYMGDYKEATTYFEKVIKLNSKDYPIAKAFYFLGEIARLANLNDKACELYQRSIKIDNNLADSYFSLALVYYNLNNFSEALTNIQKFIVLNPSSSDGYYLMTKIYIAQFNYLHAEQSIKKAILNSKDEQKLYEYKILEAKINYWLGQNAHSLEIIEEAKNIALKFKLSTYELDYLQALILIRFKEYEKAILALQNVISINPSNEEALITLIDLYFQIENYTKMSEVIEQLIKINPNNAASYAYKAHLMLKNKNYEEALKIIESNQNCTINLDKLLIVKSIILNELNKKEDAISILNKAIEVNPNSVEALYLLSKNYESIGNFEKQCELLLKAIEKQSEEKFYYDLGLCYEKLNQYQKAIEAFNFLYLKSLSEPLINYKKAEWYLKIKNYSKANECIDQYIKMCPRVIDGYLLKGEILTYEKKYEEALLQYDKAERIDPKSQKLWLSRSFTYNEMGDYIKAEDCKSIAMSNN